MSEFESGLVKLGMSEDQIRKYKNEIHKNYTPSITFGFMADHGGLKPGKKHVLMGASGSGKSTLAKSIMVQAARGGKVLLYSSEEGVDDINMMLSRYKKDQEAIANITMIHEDHMAKLAMPHEYDKFFQVLRSKIIEVDPMVFVLDNITTSRYYDTAKPEKQVEFYERLSRLLIEVGVPALIVAHTKKGITNVQRTMVEIDDIRGSAIVPNKSEFFYILQVFAARDAETDEEKVYSFARVAKCRTGGNNNQVYMLKYDHTENRYVKDTAVDFAVFKDIFKTRNKL